MDFPVIRAAAPDLNAAIVVTTPWADGVSTGHQSLHWLAEYGTRDLVRNTIVVVNNSDGNADAKTMAAVTQSFASTRCLVFEVPFDRRLRPGGAIDLNRGMSASTRHQFLEIAAALARNFGGNHLRNPNSLQPPAALLVRALHRLTSCDGISAASTRDATTINPSTIRVNVLSPTSTTTAAPGDSGSWDSG